MATNLFGEQYHSVEDYVDAMLDGRHLSYNYFLDVSPNEIGCSCVFRPMDYRSLKKYTAKKSSIYLLSRYTEDMYAGSSSDPRKRIAKFFRALTGKENKNEFHYGGNLAREKLGEGSTSGWMVSVWNLPDNVDDEMREKIEYEIIRRKRPLLNRKKIMKKNNL